MQTVFPYTFKDVTLVYKTTTVYLCEESIMRSNLISSTLFVLCVFATLLVAHSPTLLADFIPSEASSYAVTKDPNRTPRINF
jgi:hypothetical protein